MTRSNSDYRALLLAFFALSLNVQFAYGDELIDFSRDVRPVLSDNCFACHGFDESSRESGLRLDTREGATVDLGGYAAIVPGKPDESELIARISSDDDDELMPPPDSHKKRLDDATIEILRKWIQQGAPWGKHWAFNPPLAAKIPSANDGSSIHPIDYFVQKRLKENGLAIAPTAATHTLARRLSFDLTGLPPTADQVADLPQIPTEQQWSDWIDQLIDSPQYGERMAMWWLDGARYSDTDGFQQDATRQNWPWRDWVVESFNKNLPFDDFTIHQFAGDLLPEATLEHQLATCFHRNHMHNGEGGRDPAESRVDYVLDRTNTVGTLWLGLTLGCTQCHDHKFDPVSQKDYYSLTAYFNSIDETGQAGNAAKPFLKFRSPYAKRAVTEAEKLAAQTNSILKGIKADSQSSFERELDRMISRASNNFTAWIPIYPAHLRSTEGTALTLETMPESNAIVVSNNSKLAQDDFFVTVPTPSLQRITGVKLEVFADAQHTDKKYSFAPTGEFLLTNVKLQVRTRNSKNVQEIALTKATASIEGQGEDEKYGQAVGTLDDDPRTGWTTRTKPLASKQVIVFELESPLTLDAGQELDIVLMQRSLAPRELIGRFRLSLTDQSGQAVRSLDPMPMEALAAAIQSLSSDQNPNATQPFSAPDISPKLRQRLHDQFLEDQAIWQAAAQRHRQATRQLKATKQASEELNVTVLVERKTPRSTHVLERGVWDQHGEEVSPAVLPAVFPKPPAEVKTRLELAQWIVDRKNPLTARVITNQVWQLYFGAGLVRTPNDFGLQGESPTHPELLDWLAVDFMESGWDLKHLVRRIVTSRTYQQDSRVTAELLELDPENRLLARSSRFRLPSWMIRDASLKHSGLLNDALGGPPMFAYQPVGIWQDQFMGRFTYQPSLGPAQYRRTLYTFWRRSSAPTFLFDTAMRRTCEVIPRRTNTPLQALTLLNDTTALEAARTLAERIADHDSTDQRETTTKTPQRSDSRRTLNQMFQLVLSRPPTKIESEILQREYQTAKTFYDENPESAQRFATVGQLPAPSLNKASELAAKMLMASMILNMDESITHE